ncbi:hypothetical protein [Nitrosarchaeum sp.]|uniref:hypothetical protein n=1 Tax=Nitrosarchaeum sp. TaxID=2026886 RepID=UPI00247D4A43|nr:hypothetical protein [Nitrosarchaeum sp.]MCV0412198.1 hypothetical protein [Nitrosarchaeum sp.]
MVQIVLKTDDLYVEEPILWDNIFPYGTIPIFVGKKRKHVMDLLSALELRGASTTSELARFAIESHYSKGQIKEMGKSLLTRRGHYYLNHLSGREKKKIGKKTVGMYANLLKTNYVKLIDSSKSNIGVYFPTLLTHLVSLGYVYTYDETCAFIKNASRNSLYFAFLYDIMNKTSFAFVKEFFLDPIKKMIKQNRIRFDDDFRLNFDIIASATALKIMEIIQRSEWWIRSKGDTNLKTGDLKLLKELDVLIQNTWFDLQNSKLLSKWVGLYYPTEEQKWFYSQHSDFSDAQLIYKVMREIHVNYYGSYGQKIPTKYQQKFPFPIKRNRKKKTKSTNSAFHNSMMAKKLRDSQYGSKNYDWET